MCGRVCTLATWPARRSMRTAAALLYALCCSHAALAGLRRLCVPEHCCSIVPSLRSRRWFPKLLKTRDPLVFSCGWRRWQSLPVYAVEDHNRR